MNWEIQEIYEIGTNDAQCSDCPITNLEERIFELKGENGEIKMICETDVPEYLEKEPDSE